MAETHHSRGISIRPSARPSLSIDIRPEASKSEMANAILLSFVIVEQLRREAEVTSVRNSVPDKGRGYGEGVHSSRLSCRVVWYRIMCVFVPQRTVARAGMRSDCFTDAGLVIPRRAC